ncbi:hypothetical protein [Ochrobactrum sp. J50]|uniref:hypothetical protein n=1 Tax=Ochrobactrum sp. J50 TaxID=936132 RepID=UPI0011A348DF|nr:hypothetical protein [Ochrobactrum sp. J50]
MIIKPPPFETLAVTKIQAAINQIETAIAAMEGGRFDVAITLSGAAEGMLPDPPNEIHTFNYLLDRLPGDRSRKEWISILNMERDWLKHRTDRLPEKMEIDLFDVGWSIVRACVRVDTENWTPRMEEFRIWFLEYQKGIGRLKRKGRPYNEPAAS